MTQTAFVAAMVGISVLVALPWAVLAWKASRRG